MTHAPEGYDCPFCRIVRRDPSVLTQPDEIVFEDETTLAFVGAAGFGPRPGHTLVVPKAHFENLYDISPEALAAVYRTAQRIAVAYRTHWDCQGTSTRQHNEPAGNQDVWHLHVHVFPRYDEDDLYAQPRVMLERKVRLDHAERLRSALATP